MCYQMCVTPAGLTAEMFSADVKESKGKERECDNTGLFARSPWPVHCRPAWWVEPPDPGPQCVGPAVGVAVRSMLEGSETRAGH